MAGGESSVVDAAMRVLAMKIDRHGRFSS